MDATAMMPTPAITEVVNAEAGPAARLELVQRLERMAESLREGDDVSFGEQLRALVQLREQGLFTRIEQLFEHLHAAFDALDGDRHWQDIQAELPDTASRLDHVVLLTEQAAHRTLDLVEDCQRQVGQAELALAVLMAYPDAAAVGLGARMQPIHSHLRSRFAELAQTQEYQDLSGQLLKRAGRVVREVEQGLASLLAKRPQVRVAVADKPLPGPSVPGVTMAATDQADADALLAMFMSNP
jgi:chemotaxis protein CheZ